MSGGISQRQLANKFCVSLGFIEKLLKQYRETASIAPKVRTKQTPPKLNEEQIKILEEIVEAKNDSTLSEIRSELKEKTGITICCGRPGLVERDGFVASDSTRLRGVVCREGADSRLRLVARSSGISLTTPAVSRCLSV